MSDYIIDPSPKMIAHLERVRDETFRRRRFATLTPPIKAQRRRRVRIAKMFTGGGPFAWIPEEYLGKVHVHDPLDNSENLLDVVLDIYLLKSGQGGHEEDEHEHEHEEEDTSVPTPQTTRSETIEVRGPAHATSSATPAADAVPSTTASSVTPQTQPIDLTTPPNSPSPSSRTSASPPASKVRSTSPAMQAIKTEQQLPPIAQMVADSGVGSSGGKRKARYIEETEQEKIDREFQEEVTAARARRDGKKLKLGQS